MGVSAKQTGLGSAEAPEPCGLGPTDAIPNAAPWWRCLHCGCEEYEEHVFTGYMRGVPMVRCAICKILHSPPDPNSKAALRWQISELTRIVGWCQRRLHPRLHTYVDQMLANASGIAAPSGVETGNTDSTEGKSPPEGDAQGTAR